MLTNIPDILKQHPNWVCWRSVIRDGKATKVPFNAQTGYGAKADDSATWTTFDNACKAADPLLGSDYDGVGFELGGTNLIGIDFDNAINHKGVIDPYALSILKLLNNPYVEISPSGKGLHAFIECNSLPEGKRKLSANHTGIEIYSGQEGGRYFTITGERVLGESIPKITDISLPYLLILQNKDKRFRALWVGDASIHDGDESTADYDLMCRLAELTRGNTVQMESYFGLSGLGQREKWTSRKDYRERTIRAALDAVRSGNGDTPVIPSAHIEFHGEPRPDPDGDYVIAPADGQEDGWFPLGDISLIGGASGTGKTTFVFEMLHHQRHGKAVLGHKTFGRLFHVLAYDRGQNAFNRTMRRLKINPADIPTTALPLAFGTEAVQNIINEIEKMKPQPEVIFVEGMDMLLDDTNKKSTVSPFMRQLQEVAAFFHIALIGSVGAPKTKRGEDYTAKRDKISGSEAWGRNCETVAVLEFVEDDDSTANRRFFTVLPRNAAAEKFDMEFVGGRLIQMAPQPEEPANHLSKNIQAAINFLGRELQNGPKIGKSLISTARDRENITRAALYDAARIMKVDTQGVIAGQSVWTLPPMNATKDTTRGVEETVSNANIDFAG